MGQEPGAPRIARTQVEAALELVEDLVEAERTHFGTPGVAVAVVHEDEVLHAEGYGLRQVDRSEKVTADTVFALASMSKPISATALARLVGREVFAWDDPVRAHDPSLHLQDPWIAERVTFADLYSHRSGLPGLFGNTLEQIGYDRGQILSRLPLIPFGAFRASYSYSNFGLTAAGEAAARAAGTNFEQLMRDELFTPLGMKHSSALHSDYLGEKDRSAIHYAIDGRWQVGSRQPDPQSPAGGITSSLRDVTQWVRVVLGGGMLGAERVIDATALGETHSAHIQRAPLSGYVAQPSTYGLGWNVETDRFGFLRWAHSGAFSAGASTTTVLLPEESLGIVVLTNGMPQGVPEIVADELVDHIVAGRVTQDWRVTWYDERFSWFYKDSGPEVPAGPQAEPAGRRLRRPLRQRLLRPGRGRAGRRGAAPRRRPRAGPAHAAAEARRRAHLEHRVLPGVAERPFGDHLQRRGRPGDRCRPRRRGRPGDRTARPGLTGAVAIRGMTHAPTLTAPGS